ncbi:MAG: hypothetical protein HY647_06555 [Acidobacteria bacterium]|nr:hypothetical protein [Acidobacteriota bacterium]
MGLFFVLVVFWSAALYGAHHGWRCWRQWRLRQLARYVSEICGVDYFQRLSSSQFESLVMRALKTRQFTVFDDPYLGRSKKQGYAWKKGRKVVLVHRPENSITPRELEGIAKQARIARAEQALVFYPFPHAPRVSYPDLVEVLAGKRLLAWFSVLDAVVPPISSRVPDQRCECGAPLKERVNRRGQPVWVCSRFPDCRSMREADPPKPEHKPLAS